LFTNLVDFLDEFLFLHELFAELIDIVELFLGKFRLRGRCSPVESLDLILIEEVFTREPLDELLVVNFGSFWQLHVSETLLGSHNRKSVKINL
jgi:hypothetical protein